MELEADGWSGALARSLDRAADVEPLPPSALLDGLWLGPAAMAFVDRALRVVAVNESFARMAGRPAASIAGRTVRELLAGEGALAFALEDRLRAILDSGDPALDLSASSRGPDGVTRWWRARLYPVLTPRGEVRGVCAAVDETTSTYDRERALECERASAERTARRLALLQETTAALAAAVEPAEIGRVVLERVRAFAGADAVSIRVLEGDGLAPLASAGFRAPSASLAGVTPASARTPSADAVRGETGIWLESNEEVAARYPQLVAAARAEGWESGAALPLRARGRAIGSLSLSFRTPHAFDLEERALLLSVAEQCALALDRARVLARERAARNEADHDRAVLDAVLSNAPIGVVLLDPELRFVRVNPAVTAFDGAPVEAHAGRTPPEVLPSLPWSTIEPMLRAVLETGQPRLDVALEVPFPGGGVRSFLASGYRVQTGDAPIGVGAIIREVTAEREADQFQRNVLGIVGHDLRTPLTTVTASTFLLRRGALGRDEARLVARIAAACARIQQVIGILLDYARASGGHGVPVSRRACDLGVICREVADEAEGARPGRSVRCGGEGDASGDWDPDRVRQALANLVSNALEHGAPDAPVHVSWRADAERVEIDVTNAGAAIPPDLLPRIFDAFRSGRSESGARRGGLGLGLFIARAIAVAHGGAIEVRSREGETTFTLRLPRRVPAD